MNFYKYLETKIVLFESSNTVEYLYKNKILYPIINSTVFVKDQEIKTNDNNPFKKTFNNDFTYDFKNKNIKVISYHKTEGENSSESNLKPEYVEFNGVFYPLEEIEKYKKVSKDNDFKNLKLDEYQTIKKQNLNFNIYSKGSASSGGSSQPTEAEMGALENLGGETPAEETPPETPAEGTPKT